MLLYNVCATGGMGCIVHLILLWSNTVRRRYYYNVTYLFKPRLIVITRSQNYMFNKRLVMLSLNENTVWQRKFRLNKYSGILQEFCFHNAAAFPQTLLNCEPVWNFNIQIYNFFHPKTLTFTIRMLILLFFPH